MDLKFLKIFQSASSAEGGGRDPQRDVNNDGRGGGDGTGPLQFPEVRIYILYIRPSNYNFEILKLEMDAFANLF